MDMTQNAYRFIGSQTDGEKVKNGGDEEGDDEEDSEFVPPPELCLPKSMTHVSTFIII